MLQAESSHEGENWRMQTEYGIIRLIGAPLRSLVVESFRELRFPPVEQTTHFLG